MDFVVADACSLPYMNQAFDVVFCQSCLHIVIDYNQCAEELARVLKLGAKAVFCEEGLGYNPFLRPIRWVRRRKYRECGGRPLTYPDIASFGKPFSSTTIHHFNLLAQGKSAFVGQLRRRGRLPTSTRRLIRLLERIDEIVLQTAPWAKRFCGTVVVEYTR